jgi:hypothetical protein
MEPMWRSGGPLPVHCGAWSLSGLMGSSRISAGADEAARHGQTILEAVASHDDHGPDLRFGWS